MVNIIFFYKLKERFLKNDPSIEKYLKNNNIFYK